MSSPSPIARQTPIGTALEDGYQVLIALGNDPDISLWEKTLTPGGVENEDAIPTTTQHTIDWRTFAARALNTLTNTTVRVAYTPVAYGQIKAQVGKNQQITVHFPNGIHMSFWGYVKNFIPDEMAEGEQPEADSEFVATNRNPSTGAVEGPWGTAFA